MNTPTIPDEVVLIEARYLGGYKIAFHFSDGHVQEVDFYPFLSKTPQNPMVRKYLDQEQFQKFQIIRQSDISWNEYEMCFPFELLYQGDI